MLADREGGFFIEENREPQSQSEVQVCVCVYGLLLYMCSDMIIEQASGSESSDKTERTSSSQKSDDESEKEDKSGRQFAINPALVPTYIPFRVIEKVGSAVYVTLRVLSI